MATNLSGMFAGLNSAIDNVGLAPTDATVAGMTPRPQDRLPAMLQMALQGGGGLLNAVAPNANADFSTSQQAKAKADQAIANIEAPGSAKGLAEMAQVYHKLGMADKGIQVGQLAQKQAATELALRRESIKASNMASWFQENGYEAMAKEISETGQATAEHEKVYSKAQTELGMRRMNTPGKIKYAQENNMFGFFTPKQLSEMSFDHLVELRNSKVGEPVTFYNPATGKNELHTLNKFGLVEGPDGTTVPPAALGLQEAADYELREGANGRTQVWNMTTGKRVGDYDDRTQAEKDAILLRKTERNVSVLDSVDRAVSILSSVKRDAAGKPIADKEGNFIPDTWSGGIKGLIARNIPGTAAHVLEGLIGHLTANATIDTLLAIKETGATFGAINASELELLKSELADLRSSSTREELIRNIEKVGKRYARYQKVLMGKEDEVFGTDAVGNKFYKIDNERWAIIDPHGNVSFKPIKSTTK